MKPVVFHPEASDEFLAALEYYIRISAELGERFNLDIEHLVAAVGRAPQRFYRFAPPLQRALSRTFPYSLVYLEQPERVWIVAVMHAKRRPGYWRKRLR